MERGWYQQDVSAGTHNELMPPAGVQVAPGRRLVKLPMQTAFRRLSQEHTEAASAAAIELFCGRAEEIADRHAPAGNGLDSFCSEGCHLTH